ncbi:MAG: helix-turn-helix domain-containing protein [Eubacterium sp.]|nr:helix-turn-helix domain-containing protein [Eubacterium sp.]
MISTEDIRKYMRNELLNSRIQFHLTQEEMAEKLGISLRNYINLEHGKSLMSSITLINYINHLNIDKDKFFSDLAEIIDNSYD